MKLTMCMFGALAGAMSYWGHVVILDWALSPCCSLDAMNPRAQEGLERLEKHTLTDLGLDSTYDVEDMEGSENEVSTAQEDTGRLQYKTHLNLLAPGRP